MAWLEIMIQSLHQSLTKNSLELEIQCITLLLFVLQYRYQCITLGHWHSHIIARHATVAAKFVSGITVCQLAVNLSSTYYVYHNDIISHFSCHAYNSTSD